MMRAVRPDQVRRILALAEELGPGDLKQARIDLQTLTADVAKFYIDTLSADLRKTRQH